MVYDNNTRRKPKMEERRIRINDAYVDAMNKIDACMKKHEMRLDYDFMLDETGCISASYIGKSNRYYRVSIFGNPYSEKWYFQIKCGAYVTKISLATMLPKLDYMAIGKFLSMMESGNY